MHCWNQGPPLWIGFRKFVSQTCILPDGHDGACVFVADGAITITALPEEALDRGLQLELAQARSLPDDDATDQAEELQAAPGGRDG